jgi:hypothetical protein
MPKKLQQPMLVGELKPLEIEKLSIEDQCLLDLIVEASDQARAEGHEGELALQGDHLEEMIRQRTESAANE